MISRVASVAVAIAVALAPFCAAETDKEVEARKTALDLAGAFANDGFKVRDGHWTGSVKKGDRAVVAVNLYAGNEYWFSVGTAAETGKFTVNLFDEHGQPVATEDFAQDNKAAVGYSPTISGQYFVAIAAPEADTGTLCLVYSYK